ncbi:hypothetical protein Ddc_14718 [Ditylenchus destructor]|nr:hypothetical protein Ddc_14718 [Ditylenchus destructor]
MMLPAYVLLDILKCMNREDLLKIQETTRVINDIIRHDFASKPLRLFDVGSELRIQRNENNELRLRIRAPNGRFAPTIPGCQECVQRPQRCPQHSHSIDEMRPFLANYMRYRRVEIHLWTQDFRITTYTPEQVTLLESISHIWRGQTLSFDHSSRSSLQTILRNSTLLHCRRLEIYCVYSSELFRQHPNLYTVPIIYFSMCFTENHILDIIRKKSNFPQSETLFVIIAGLNPDVVQTTFETTIKEFLKSAYPCRLKMIIQTTAPSIGFTRSSYYRAENNRTKEVMELRCVTKAEVKDKFDVNISCPLGYDAWIVERRSV